MTGAEGLSLGLGGVALRTGSGFGCGYGAKANCRIPRTRKTASAERGESVTSTTSEREGLRQLLPLCVRDVDPPLPFLDLGQTWPQTVPA